MGSGASASKDAPHLAEYFRKLGKKSAQTQEEATKHAMEILMSGNTDRLDEMKKDMAEWYDQDWPGHLQV